MEASSSVNYVLYTHYSYAEDDDFNAWCAGIGKGDFDVFQLAGVCYFNKHLRGMQELLTAHTYEGNLVVFYALGFAACLDGIATGKTRQQLVDESREIAFSEQFGHTLTALLDQYPGLSRRIRIITPIDLYDTFGRMNRLTANDLRWWFIGKSEKIRYDTPKIVEAFIRLRLLGAGVPVFRLDQDVLFGDEENCHLPDLGLFKAVASCLHAYRLRLNEPGMATFLLSASYNSQALAVPEQAWAGMDKKEIFERWGRAFATRIFPALPVEPELLDDAKASGEWERYAIEVFDDRLARKFYGLHKTELASDGICGIGKIGAHPFSSIISGAMLCLSDGAILDLPPFSNFTLNVMWIDDHLKYSLHRELRHLKPFGAHALSLPGDAKLDGILVNKKRPPISNLPGYVLGNYLPTVLWGTVVDAWINGDPMLKYRREDLPEEHRRDWDQAKRQGRSEGVLAAALQTALEKGAFMTGERLEIERALIQSGLQRITEVRRQWAQLKTTEAETFASIWAKGSVADFFPDLPRECHGIAHQGISIDKALVKTTDLNEYQLHDDFLTLVDDALEYIEWTLNWPTIVQVVRSVEQGTVKTDLSWVPPEPQGDAG